MPPRSAQPLMAARSSETYATKASVASKSDVAMPSSFGNDGIMWLKSGAEKLRDGLLPNDQDGSIELQSKAGMPVNGGPMVAVGIGAGPYFTTGGPTVTGTPYIGTTLPNPWSMKLVVAALARATSPEAADANVKVVTISRLKTLTSRYFLTLSTHVIYKNYIITIKNIMKPITAMASTGKMIVSLRSGVGVGIDVGRGGGPYLTMGNWRSIGRRMPSGNIIKLNISREIIKLAFIVRACSPQALAGGTWRACRL